MHTKYANLQLKIKTAHNEGCLYCKSVGFNMYKFWNLSENDIYLKLINSFIIFLALFLFVFLPKKSLEDK